MKLLYIYSVMGIPLWEKCRCEMDWKNKYKENGVNMIKFKNLKIESCECELIRKMKYEYKENVIHIVPGKCEN